jgi:hypothetical protein
MEEIHKHIVAKGRKRIFSFEFLAQNCFYRFNAIFGGSFSGLRNRRIYSL